MQQEDKKKRSKHHQYIGLKYNSLTIKKTWTGPAPQRRAFCEAQCDCGELLETRVDNVRSGKTIACKRCSGSIRSKRMLGSNSPSWRGVGKVGSVFFKDIKRSAKRRNKEFSLTLEYISGLFEQQQQRCALSGLEIDFGRARSAKTTASLDRIDSSLGYVEGNVQWVHKDINMMKKNLPDEYFILLCSYVCDYNKNRAK